MKRFGIFLGLLAIIVSSCQRSYVDLDASSMTLALDSCDQLVATIKPSGENSKNNDFFVWESSDTSILTVDNQGVVCGKKVGNADVIVYADETSDTCHVSVKIRVDSVQLNVRSVRVKDGSKARLKARVFPSNATDSIVDWQSSDTSVAVVNDGLVVSRGPGIATVTASIDGQNVICAVNVITPEEWATEMSNLARRRGGNVDGAVRFTLQWNDKGDWNMDDLDAHCIEPNRSEICFHNMKSRSKGMLDVDNRRPDQGVKAVENISWSSTDKMKPGVYKFNVERYAARDGKSGFRAEIEFEGQLYKYDYRGGWTRKKNTRVPFWGRYVNQTFPYVPVCELHVEEDGTMYIEHKIDPVE